MAGPIETRIAAIAVDVLLPGDIGATAFTPDVQARCACLVLLAHAEIEYGIETACRQAAGTLRDAADPATALMIWGLMHVAHDGEVAKIGARLPIDALCKAYDRVVDKNHGIKEANLRMLLAPLGVDLAALNTEVAALEAFGGERGDLAHRPLNQWVTSNLPSAQVSNARQAGLFADVIVDAIHARNSQVKFTAGKSRRWRLAAADVLHRAAHFLER